LLATATFLANIGRATAQQVPPRDLESAELHRILTVPVNLDHRSAVIVDPKQISQALFGPENSVASRYRALSYGRLGFAGSAADVADPVAIAEPADFCETGLGHLADSVEAVLRRRGIALDTYQHIVFVIPRDAPCSWTGLGAIGGSRVWVKASTAKALQHELGHNLGMNHAVQWHGSGADASDLMGSGENGLNAPHVVESGWLRNFPGKVVEPATAMDIALEPLESDPSRSALPKVAIVRPTAGANLYYLSYRAASAGNPLPAEFTRGLNIHIADPSYRTGGLTYFVVSLADGMSYRDGPMAIRQISHVEGGQVTVRLSFAGTGAPLPAGPPPPPAGTVQSIASGKCLDLPGGRAGDGTAVIQYDCHGGPNQQWEIEPAGETTYRIVSRMSDKCLGIDPAAAAPGGHILQSQCGSSATQRWTVRRAGDRSIIRSASNGLCLDVPGASASNGAEPIAWTCNGGSNQAWRLPGGAAAP
jgi:hypothetical protein